MYRALDTYPARIQRVSNVSRCILKDTSVSHLYHACIYTSRSGYIPGYIPDTYIGYISPDTFQIQLQIHMYPMYSVLLVLGYNGYVTIHMWIHVSRYFAGCEVIVCDTSLGACEVVRDAYQLCVLRE